MQEWQCPACDFKATGSEEEIEAQKAEHVAEKVDDEAHEQVTIGGPSTEESGSDEEAV